MNIQKIVNECKERGTARAQLKRPCHKISDESRCDSKRVYEFAEKYVAEIVNAEEECYVRAVIQAARDAGVTTLDLIDKEFVVSAIKHEQERRGIK